MIEAGEYFDGHVGVAFECLAEGGRVLLGRYLEVFRPVDRQDRGFDLPEGRARVVALEGTYPGPRQGAEETAEKAVESVGA